MAILTLLEVTGIQSYIFGSNQLAQHIGASELVRQVSDDWVHEMAPEAVVYAGGGNALLIFNTREEAERFARELSKRALMRARGLQLVIKHRSFDPKSDSLAEVHQKLREEMAKRKRDRIFSTPLSSVGVTATCVYTGKPAVGEDIEGRFISTEVQHKLVAEKPGRKRLQELLPQVARRGYDFVYDFNDLGTPGESSYLAIIHTDGNRMGQRIKAIGEQYARPEQNEQYQQALKDFSDSVREAANHALRVTVDALLDAVVVEQTPEGEKRSIGDIPLRRRGKNGPWLLPFRPIVFGGDDVTFVSEGRLGLSVAAKYLQVFSSQILSDGEPAYCRAGIAVVKTHYPFSRAYELAEALCASAKRFIVEEANSEGRLTALDWHFAVGGLVLPLEQIRQREYKVPFGNLLMRPVRLNPPDGDWRSWKTFTTILEGFMQNPWAEKRNKIKALRKALREGPEATKHFLALYNLSLPEVPGEPDLTVSGWHGSGRCGYWDAIEALDFYVPLEGEVQ